MSTIDRDASKGEQRRHGSGLLDRGSAIDILSIKFVELLLLVSDWYSASILSQLRNSDIIEELADEELADSIDRKLLPLTHPRLLVATPARQSL